MAMTPKRLYVGQPTTSAGVNYLVGGSVNQAIVKNIILCNTTGTDAVIHLHIVPTSGSPSTSNKVLSSYVVKANESIILDLSATLERGDSIQSLQTTNGAITLFISGVEVS